MNGAQSLLETLVNCGIEVCFTNPGTSEMHFLAALDQQPGMRAVLGLFEGVVTGAADGYARMADRPACTLLHLGPGLANGLANLHNARRARSPIVNVVGEHATYHRALDAPLTSNIEGFAAPVSGWIHVSERAAEVAADGARAAQACHRNGGQIATLVLPADTAWNDAGAAAPVLPTIEPTTVPTAKISAAAAALRSGQPTVILCNGRAMREDCLQLLGKIDRHTGAQLMGDTFIGRVERGAGRVEVPRLPYFAEQAQEALLAFAHVILVDTKAPVSFFAYPGKASELTPSGAEVHPLTTAGDDTLSALQALANELGAERTEADCVTLSRPALPRGILSAERIAQAVAALLPEHAIVVNEAATGGFAMPGLNRQWPAAQLAGSYGRRNWNGAARGDRGGNRLSRPPSLVFTGRWQCHVHRTGPMDPGARKNQCYHRTVFQSQVRDPASRIHARRGGQSRTQGHGHDGIDAAGSQLGENGGKHGGARGTHRHSRGIFARIGGGTEPSGTQPDRGGTVKARYLNGIATICLHSRPPLRRPGG